MIIFMGYYYFPDHIRVLQREKISYGEGENQSFISEINACNYGGW